MSKGIIHDWLIEDLNHIPSDAEIEKLKEKIEQAIDELKMKWAKIFGISMAGKYRNQGMLEYCKDLKLTLLTERKSK